MEIVLALVLGSLFGFTLYLIGAGNPNKILNMLRLKDFTLMKTILFGIGFGSVLLFIGMKMGGVPGAHLDIKPAHLGVIVGGALFGLSFGLAGYCPGTAITAGGSGRSDAWMYIIGGLFGAFAFSNVYSYFSKNGWFEVMFDGKGTLFSLSSEIPSVFTISASGGILVGLLFMAIAYFLPERV